ncbi:MAG TPA: hypothetical protein VGM77_13265 [Gemmatimonadales bacterium]
MPFDTRLETIDQGERLFQTAKLRFATDHIGLARLPEGLELVRVGPALRPEFAAWRYGDQFGRRRRDVALKTAAASAALPLASGVIAFAAGIAMPTEVVGGLSVPALFILAVMVMARRRTAGIVAIADGEAGVVTVESANASRIIRRADGEWGLELHAFGQRKGGFAVGRAPTESRFWGAEAAPLLGQVLPIVNRMTGTRGVVRDAVELVTDNRSVPQILRRGEMLGRQVRYVPPGQGSRSTREPADGLVLAELPLASALALEMFTHEESERALLTADLALLERRWREADRLAKIADELVTG